MENCCCLAHAAGIHDSQEDVEVLELHAAANPVAELHRATHSSR
jgi:hypothetical protein